MDFSFIGYLIIFFGSVNLIRMAMFLVGSDLYRLQAIRSKRQNRKPRKLPMISVIIPAHNEEATILRAISSIFKNGYPLNKLEVIISNNASTDATGKIVRNYIHDNPHYQLRIVHTRIRGKAHALNRAIRCHAKGELIMCLDADSYIGKGSLRNAATYFLQDKRVAALSSNVKIIKRTGLLNLIQQFEYLICYQMKRAQTVFNIEYIIGGIGSIFRREILENIGFYDTNTVTEDIDITLKILQRGNRENRVIYGADVIAYTESALSITDLMKQRFRWKYGRSQTFFKNRNLFFNQSSTHSKGLTWIYLPLAVFFDLAFFFEPIMIAYISFIIIRYADFATLASAILIIASYIIMNIWAEDSLTVKEKIRLTPIAPTMYFYFYILSFVEYYALLSMLIQIKRIPESISSGKCDWQHVARTSVAV